jgi:hypothetical protein
MRAADRSRRTRAGKISQGLGINEDLALDALKLSRSERRDLDKAIRAGLDPTTAATRATALAGSKKAVRRQALEQALSDQTAAKGPDLDLSPETIQAIAQATLKLMLETTV